MKRLYAKYHPQGVEFIGASQDLPEDDGGLAAFKSRLWPKATFLAPILPGSGIQPRFWQGQSTGESFQSVGSRRHPHGLPDRRGGQAYLTHARGQPETLIPRLLATSKLSTENKN